MNELLQPNLICMSYMG